MKCPSRRLMVVVSAVVFTVICLVQYYYYDTKSQWNVFTPKFDVEGTLTTDEINERWSWTTFDTEKAAKDNAVSYADHFTKCR